MPGSARLRRRALATTGAGASARPCGSLPVRPGEWIPAVGQAGLRAASRSPMPFLQRNCQVLDV